MQDLNEMSYLECCIKESLRLYPSVPFISRYVEKELNIGEYNSSDSPLIETSVSPGSRGFESGGVRRSKPPVVLAGLAVFHDYCLLYAAIRIMNVVLFITGECIYASHPG